MASQSALFIRPREGLLRDFFDAAQLKEYMKQYGEVAHVWVPWRNDDRRYFGFTEFKDPKDAEKFEDGSPHKLQMTDLLVDFKTQAKQKQASVSKQATASNELTNVLVPLPDVSGKYSWESYFATERVKSALMGIGKELDPKHKERVRNSQEALFGDPQLIAPGMPLVLFHGPPGTGKTHTQWWKKHAQQLSGLEVWVLGHLSSMVSLSFPELWAVANCMVSCDAAKQEGGAPARKVGFSEYVREVMSEARQHLLWSPAVAASLQKAQNAVWTVSSVLFLLDRIGRFRAPRARL
jgi:hypothetical protein